MRIAPAILLALCSAALPAQSPRADRALSMPGHQWLRRTTPNARVYVLKGSAAERRADVLPAAVERAVKADLLILREKKVGRPLNLFFVGTPAEMLPLAGRASGGYSIPEEGTSFLVADTLAPPLRHEIMHLLSWRFWGTPATAWLSEGIATLAAGGCGGASIEQIVGTMYATGRLIPLDTLWRNFDVKDEKGLINYMEGASLVSFVDRTFGRAKLRALWPMGAWREIEQRIGVDRSTLERRWRAEVARSTARVDWNAMMKATHARGCETDVAWPKP